MSDAIIRVENLSKRYTINHQTGGSYRKFSDALIHSAKAPLRWLRPQSPGHSQESFWALKDVNFEIKQGEVVGIIGRNGAGKSTLLKILSRITEPTSGRITLKGRVASLLEVGTGFHPELTGRENIYLNGAILGMTKVEIRSKFDEIVAFAEIEKFLDTPVKRYSSGMYVRLAFAVAAHLDPEILIVDEVLAVGDAQFQKKCLGKMQDVAAGGRTVLFVSHNLSVVQELCTKAILLKSGTVAMEGKPAAIASAYLLSGAPQGPEIDLATSKRAGTPKQGCRIEKATAAGENAQRGFFFDFNERIRFSVTVSASQDLGEAELGIALLTPGRFEIASSLSSHSLPKSTLPKGEHVFHICYNDLRLTPGIYVADLGIKSDRGIEDRITDAFEFEILAQEEAVTASTHVCSGVVIPSVTFNLVKK